MENEKLNEMLKGVWDSLTDEQKEKAKACKTENELWNFAGSEGIELPDEALDAVAGGRVVETTSNCGFPLFAVYNNTTGKFVDGFLYDTDGSGKQEAYNDAHKLDKDVNNYS